MLVITTKAHQNSHGKKFEKALGDKYENARPDADITFGNVMPYGTDEEKKAANEAIAGIKKKIAEAAKAEQAQADKSAQSSEQKAK